MYTGFEHLLINALTQTNYLSSMNDRILPILVENCHVPASLLSIRYLDFRHEATDGSAPNRSNADEEKRLLETMDHMLVVLNNSRLQKQLRVDREIEQIFADMTILHEDYRTAFYTLIPDLYEESINSIRNKILKRKFSLQPLRDKTNALIEVFLQSRFLAKQPNEVRRFFKICGHYLCAGGSTYYTNVLDVLCSTGEMMDVRSYLVTLIPELDTSWQELAVSYAELKARSLS